MIYTQLKLNNGQFFLTNEDLGEKLEIEFERLGYKVELPTNADWGYVFRTTIDGNKLDISVLTMPNEVLGVAIEVTKGLFSHLFKNSKQIAVDRTKIILSDFLKELILIPLLWYTSDDWRTTFGQDFWSSSID